MEQTGEKTAFVVGGTGETGKILLQMLLEKNAFKQVASIARRELENKDNAYNNLEQVIVNFDKLETDHADAFKGYDVGFCCLGTTKGKSGTDGFIKVDHDYVMAVARLAKAGGCKHFVLMSSMGADAKSGMLYKKIKGQVEEECKQVGFEKLSIFRPGVLLVDREERRAGEGVFRFMLKPVAWMFPTLITTPIEMVAVAMINNVQSPSNQSEELLCNKEIHNLATVK
ncbi:PREDICTED: oxidoreductase HTATIP2-like isoform X2 [Priapulus caudatus]|uniref:Protein HTATIP2 n=1 Tax=Priapulus caudatus TaxID=37621 RepID=A0ABM1EB49_PRICU|nr:PREDICTED: oxidoreductase HTATIP2-like isoform X1 [Priapulus caudatus]XP_014669420.1 PREDICTED: oxidoreductase HTATIP2-like isoform X2 [Priapulus caudatus]